MVEFLTLGTWSCYLFDCALKSNEESNSVIMELPLSCVLALYKKN